MWRERLPGAPPKASNSKLVRKCEFYSEPSERGEGHRYHVALLQAHQINRCRPEGAEKCGGRGSRSENANAQKGGVEGTEGGGRSRRGYCLDEHRRLHVKRDASNLRRGLVRGDEFKLRLLKVTRNNIRGVAAGEMGRLPAVTWAGCPFHCRESPFFRRSPRNLNNVTKLLFSEA